MYLSRYLSIRYYRPKGRKKSAKNTTTTIITRNYLLTTTTTSLFPITHKPPILDPLKPSRGNRSILSSYNNIHLHFHNYQHQHHHHHYYFLTFLSIAST